MNVNRQIMQQYEAIREKNKRLQATTRDEIYKKIPRIEELKSELRYRAFDLMSDALKDINSPYKNSDSQFIDDDKIINMLAEISYLLTKNGYAENALELKYDCELCKDTGSFGTRRCKCYEQKLIRAYYNQSNLATKLEKENFENFNLSLFSDEISEYSISPRENIKNIARDAKTFVKHFNDDNLQNMFFYGKSGQGKTFMCSCIAKELIDKSYTVLYLTSTNLFNLIMKNKFIQNNSFSNDDSNYEMIYSCDLLILDDLGTENKTSFTQSELFDIINQRLDTNKKMIISTNIDIDKIDKNYGNRIASRIIGNFMPLNFYGSDLRLYIALQEDL